jgi:hypothetical protein
MVNQKCYVEIVVTTILSLVSAALWINLMIRFIKKYYKDNLWVIFMMAVVMTLISIGLLVLMFKHKQS